MTYCISCPIFNFSELHVAPTLMQFSEDEGLPLKSYKWCDLLSLFRPVTLAVSIPSCKTLDLQLSLYCPLYYNSTALCPLLECLRTTSAILAGAHSYFVVSSLKCKVKNSCQDLISNSPIYCEDKGSKISSDVILRYLASQVPGCLFPKRNCREFT